MKITNKILSDKESVEALSSWMASHYLDLEKASKKIGKQRWEDLLSETILQLLEVPRIPENIFTDGKEFVYCYVSMYRLFVRNNAEFIKKFTFNTDEYLNEESYDEDEYILHVSKYSENYYLKSQEQLSDLIYKLYFEVALNLFSIGEITDYDLKCFLLKFYPSHIKDFMNLKDADYNLLKNKPSYRNIQKVTKINYLSIRYTTLFVLEKINKIVKVSNI